MTEIGLGIAGLGTVGAGVVLHLEQNSILLAERLGCVPKVRRIAVRDLERARAVAPSRDLLTTDWREVVGDPEVRIVVELMGGLETARELVMESIRQGKTVITANKALLAEHGRELFAAAAEARVPIYFEAAVAGGIPIIKVMREALIGNHILSIHGIINGTSNYILTRMTEGGLGFPEALQEAQAEGYAEADPTLDVNGWDAAHKAIILASLAYGFWVPSDEVHVEGIDALTADDIRFASLLGYRIKPLAVIKTDAGKSVEVRVTPALIPKSHVLASVNGVFNAVTVQGDVVGETLYYGRGAGQDPTASSVLSDICEAVANLDSPRRCYGFTPHGLYGTCKPLEETVSAFYLRLTVIDQPGVLAQVAGILGQANIGIMSMIQPEAHEMEATPLVLMLHDARMGDMRRAGEAIGKLDCVRGRPMLVPVETFGVV